MRFKNKGEKLKNSPNPRPQDQNSIFANRLSQIENHSTDDHLSRKKSNVESTNKLHYYFHEQIIRNINIIE